MVKGQLKVLRHKRTEAGYFNEFLIAKTPEDVENCCLPALVIAGLTDAETGVIGAPSSSADSHMLTFHHSSVYGQTSRSDFHGASEQPSVFDVSWRQAPLPPPPPQQQQQQQQLGLQLCFSHHSEAQLRILNGSDQAAMAATSASVDIGRQEVVVTTSAAGSSGRASGRQHPQLDMAAGMGKMKISLGNVKEPIRRLTPAPPSLPQPPPPLPPPLPPRPTSTSEETPPLESESQRRRRERNRAAAARCRKKRQDQLDCLSEAVRDLEAENATLESRVADLMAARSDLISRLREHRVFCEDVFMLTPPDCGLEMTLDTGLASITTSGPATGGQEFLLTPSLLLPPPLPPMSDGSGNDFKLEPL